jgi:AraC family transcriptional regulator, regulatory protein of adaptative response / methylated-DNA-[protein]-cysteine methyltransferase
MSDDGHDPQNGIMMMFDEVRFWKAVQDRDKSFDGQFFFGVMTTGVYCRPSCACRLPLRANVRFFLEPADAERAGLRACLRCRPLATRGVDPDMERIRKSCEYIRANVESEELPLALLAAEAGLSPFHYQRCFKAVMGVTPRQFVEACRLESLKGNLRGKRHSVTSAIYESGFGSGSRVYERVDTRLGMTPATYRAGGKGASISYASVDSPLGRMMIGATDRGLCFLQFGEADEQLVEMLHNEYPAASISPLVQPYPPAFQEWMDALRDHVNGQRPRVDLPLDLQATAFQMKVWSYLQSIPAGHVESYAEVAKGIGQASASRAVARACASNRVALVIPCHRVIRGTGELGGYRWGLERKRTLIDRERAVAAQ